VSLLQLVATAAILWTTRHWEPFSLADVLSLQMLLAVLNGLSLVLSVVLFESRRLQSLHSTVLDSMRNAVAITDGDGVVINANPSCGRPQGRPVRRAVSTVCQSTLTISAIARWPLRILLIRLAC